MSAAAQYQVTPPYGVPQATDRVYPGQGAYPGQAPYPAPGGYPGQMPYPTPGVTGGYPGQPPYPAQGGMTGGYPGQLPYPTQGVTGGYPGQVPYPTQGGVTGGYPGQTPYPAPGGGAMGTYPGQPPYGAGGDGQLEARLDAMMQGERQDFGVPPSRGLHGGAMHAPTPNQIPGGQVITTKGVYELVRGAGVPVLIFDVLGAGETLPNAIAAVPASSPGSFQDQTQQQFGQFLAQATQRNMDTPLVFYCQGTQCWMSYNAALRAINLGYRNVLWYRGGLEAWKQAGLPTQQAAMSQQQPSGPGGRPNARY
jgi:PQQ-dependent catabolism-associated CXXCW motif protein